MPKTQRKRCANGTRRNKKTGSCEAEKSSNARLESWEVNKIIGTYSNMKDEDVVRRRLNSIKFKPRFSGQYYPSAAEISRLKKNRMKECQAMFEHELLYKQAMCQVTEYNKGYILAGDI